MASNPTLSSTPRTLLSSRTGTTFVVLDLKVAEEEEEAKSVVGAEVVATQVVLKDLMIKKEKLKSASPTMDSGQVMDVHTSSTTTESVLMNTSATFALRSPM